MSYLMGIDLGSTSIKAIIYDINGTLISSGSYPTEISYLDRQNKQWAFWDPEKILFGVASVTKQAISKIENPKMVKALAVTGMGMDGLPVSNEGKWLYPFISWHCVRTEAYSRMWKENPGAEKIFNISGKQITTYDTIYRLLWMKDNFPDILSKTEKWLLIEDFVNFVLCGRMATDYSMASSTSVLNQIDRDWSKELIDFAGIDINLFPEILQSGTVLGEVTREASEFTGLSEGTPVVLGGHDYLCAALAVGAFKPGIVMDITGTWEMIITSTEKPNLETNIFESGLILESHVVKEMYSYTGWSLSSGMLEWFRKNYGFEEKQLSIQNNESDWYYLMKRAESSPCGSKGVFFLPHFSGSFCPNSDSHSLGAFILNSHRNYNYDSGLTPIWT